MVSYVRHIQISHRVPYKPKHESCAGKSGGRLRDNDALEEAVSCATHDALLLLAASGKAYSLRAWRVPEASRTSAGTSVAQVLGLPSAERFTAMMPVGASWDVAKSLVMATTDGCVKRTTLSAISSLKGMKRRCTVSHAMQVTDYS